MAARILRRDSAATRYLVWLLVVVAVLTVPALSAVLPQWRVLPRWAGNATEAVALETRQPSFTAANGPVQLPQSPGPVNVDRPVDVANHPAAELPNSRPASGVSLWNWAAALPLVWAMGSVALIVRLTAARWMLWNTERRAMVVSRPMQPSEETDDLILTAFAAAPASGHRSRGDIAHPPGEDDPGGLGYFSMPPHASRGGAALERRAGTVGPVARTGPRQSPRHGGTVPWAACLCDALVQSAGVVRRPAPRRGARTSVRRSCAGGRRPPLGVCQAPARRGDAPFAHLLEACVQLGDGAKPSIEGRLVAVLSENLNRRGVSASLAAIAPAIAVGIAVPLAMLRAAEEKPGEEPKPTTTDMIDVRSEPPASVKPSVQPNATEAPGARFDMKASAVLENVKKYDAIYESGYSVSGTMVEQFPFNADTGARRREERRWKFTHDGNRWGWKGEVIHFEIPENQKAGSEMVVRTRDWGYGGNDASGLYFQDTNFRVTAKNETTETGKGPMVVLYGPRARHATIGVYDYMWALGRMFSKELDKVTRVERSKDGLIVVSARGRNPVYEHDVNQGNGRWELDIEPAAAWMVRKARYYPSGEPDQVYTKMTNSGTVWSGSYCIPKEAAVNLFANDSERNTRQFTFDPVVEKFDEKLYGDVQQAVTHNKESNLKLDDNRVSPRTFTEPNRTKPERTGH